ncbi:MAG TPA: nitroreductase family protein [Bacillota bacterium]|nr:nitroreductase family protein [Bacillota bacterium]
MIETMTKTMNETMKTILNRRSIRAYQPRQISEPELEAILEAGKFAPSGMNTQPWHFSVIQNQVLLTKINNWVKEGLIKSGPPMMAEQAKKEGFSVFYHTPTLIVVSGDPKDILPQIDCALAMENMFLAAASLGIGSCWINALGMTIKSDTNQALLKEIGVPEGYQIYSSGAFGYETGEAPAAAPRKEGTVNIVR